MFVFFKNGLTCPHLQQDQKSIWSATQFSSSPAWAVRTCKRGASLCHTPGRGRPLTNHRLVFRSRDQSWPIRALYYINWELTYPGCKCQSPAPGGLHVPGQLRDHRVTPGASSNHRSVFRSRDQYSSSPVTEKLGVRQRGPRRLLITQNLAGPEDKNRIEQPHHLFWNA